MEPGAPRELQGSSKGSSKAPRSKGRCKVSRLRSCDRTPLDDFLETRSILVERFGRFGRCGKPWKTIISTRDSWGLIGDRKDDSDAVCHLRTRFTSKNSSFEFSSTVQMVLKAFLQSPSGTLQRLQPVTMCFTRLTLWGEEPISCEGREKCQSFTSFNFSCRALGWNFGTLELSAESVDTRHLNFDEFL